MKFIIGFNVALFPGSEPVAVEAHLTRFPTDAPNFGLLQCKCLRLNGSFKNFEILVVAVVGEVLMHSDKFYAHSNAVLTRHRTHT